MAGFMRQVAAAHFHEIARAKLALLQTRLGFALRELQRVQVFAKPKSGRLGVVAQEARVVVERLRASRQFARKRVVVRLTGLRIGEVCLVALPFEIYSDTGDFLWTKARIVPICYANGYWGYVPSPAAAEDDYEAMSSPFDRRADASLREGLIRMTTPASSG